MKLIPTEEAVGHILCHDLTQIIRGEFKGPRFRKGHVVTKEDIPVLLSMGKERLYVWEVTPDMIHEDDAAKRLAALCGHKNMKWSEPKEGKIEIKAACDGFFRVASQRLIQVNSSPEAMIATRKGNTAVRAGQKLAGTRIIPLAIKEELLKNIEAAAGTSPLLEVLPFVKKTAVIIATGNEVLKGRIKDTFSPVVKEKLEAYGIRTLSVLYSGDGADNVAAYIKKAKELNPDIVICTGGMSVDPDDTTPAGIRKSGAEIITYGAPVLPGAMFLLAYAKDGTPILGLPGCVMFANATIFDLVLPYIAADVPMTKTDFAAMGEGGLCLGCPVCHYPICPFGK
ncbi:MAG: molybdopterin-binding protein [Acidaminococcus sp.]|jgi:molybdopterin biosynthesis enzyme|nr:molybdopterin-binding protein [Acidaminococcus sp.]MCI2100431.1 molybdopterin-binding protein [Acidaminococcus sp.]MCI2114752.1 molybdopterin-binding protein [Acidaminococcus sp.]MCI2116828.1 molybdopterin-binding protein [Acidaminococcus sp.]